MYAPYKLTNAPIAMMIRVSLYSTATQSEPNSPSRTVVEAGTVKMLTPAWGSNQHRTGREDPLEYTGGEPIPCCAMPACTRVLDQLPHTGGESVPCMEIKYTDGELDACVRA